MSFLPLGQPFFPGFNFPNYAGCIINQNALTSGILDWRGPTFQSQMIYQTFHLPDDYQIGTTGGEIRYPDLSGFEVMVTVDEGFARTATLDYTFDQFVPGSGWTSIIKGKQIGASAHGQTWVHLDFDAPQPITADVVKSLFRIGVQTKAKLGGPFRIPCTVLGQNAYLVENELIEAELEEGIPFPLLNPFGPDGYYGFLLMEQGFVTFSAQQGISGLCYVNPSPFGPLNYAYYSPYWPYNYAYNYYYGYPYYNEVPLLAAIAAEEAAATEAAELAILQAEAHVSINFRIMAMVADSGTDFLGNKYRSCVTLTSKDYWMSEAQPSPFAVVNRYFDVRPDSVTPIVGTVNLISNPSFEYDANTSLSPYAWSAYDYLVVRDNLQVVTTWATSGAQSLRSTSTFTANAISPAPFSGVLTPGIGTSGIPVQTGVAYSAGCEVNILSLPSNSAGVTLNLTWYNAAGGIISVSTSNVLTTIGIQALSITSAIAPSTALYASLSVIGVSNTSGTLDFYVDSVQMTATKTPISYFDGDSPGNFGWLGSFGQSISATLITQDVGNTVVIDGVLVDPITPNVAFNVYYSLDDARSSANMTERDWEQKLWTRVPKAFVATQSQQYVFPDPVIAKYMKIEFTNLPAQTYSPGTFIQPTTYKKFPTWVADFFIAQLEQTSFIANLVNVQNDALTFAYDYYLDDLGQAPADPIAAPADIITTLTNYFQAGNRNNLVDAATLNKINLVMSSFQVPTGHLVDTKPLIGAATQNIIAAATPLTSETPNSVVADYSLVSTLQREPVIFEQSLPVMFFFIPCRHTYKQLTATFDFNRAYFVGTNNIVFLRSNYSTATDSALYVESGGDMQNAEINDFYVAADQNWYTHAN